MAISIRGSDTANLVLKAPLPPRAMAARPTPGLLSDVTRRLLRDRLAVVSLAVIVLVLAAAILAPIIAPYGYADVDLGKTWSPPGPGHLLGTDALGRDVLSRLIYGARVSMSVVLVTLVIILAVGVPVGAVAGFVGGRVDAVIMRLIDAIYAFPDLLFVIAFTTFYKALMLAFKQGNVTLLTNLDDVTGGALGIFVAIGVTYWLTPARVVRGLVLSLKEREFVEAARSLGVTDFRIVSRHILPNCLAVVIVSASLYLPQAIMVEASLSFLGLGVNPPMASWGVMVAEGLTSMRAAPHLILAPAAAIAMSMLAFNFLGDGLRDALDPYMR
jgi:oligopeptide transport system permease protein